MQRETELRQELGTSRSIVLLLGAVQGCAVLDLLSPSRQRRLLQEEEADAVGGRGGNVSRGGIQRDAVARAGERFGTEHIVDVLLGGRRGTAAMPISRLNRVDLPTFGRPTMATVKLIGPCNPIALAGR